MWTSKQAEKYPMPFYWMLVINRQRLLLRFVRSLREGDFQLYVQVCDELGNMALATDLYNYSRDLPTHSHETWFSYPQDTLLCTTSSWKVTLWFRGQHAASLSWQWTKVMNIATKSFTAVWRRAFWPLWSCRFNSSVYVNCSRHFTHGKGIWTCYV